MHFQALLALIVTAVAVNSFSGDSAERRHFHGYTVLRLRPNSQLQLDFLTGLANNDSELDFWIRPSFLNHTCDVMVSPKSLLKLSKSIKQHEIEREFLINDVESAVISERETLPQLDISFRAPVYGPDSFFDGYHRTDEIFTFLNSLVEGNKELASIANIGRSFEGKDLRVIKIGTNHGSNAKPIIYIDGGIHAREWVAVSTALFIAHKLISEKNDPMVKQLLDYYDWYILPVANPDGYEYTHNRDRMWRKTRSTTGSLWGCRGIDPNRNFDFHWNEVGASDNPCSEIYAGPRAFSEPETRAISDMILGFKQGNQNRIVIFLALHSYSQLFLTPWGYTATLPNSYPDLELKAKVAVKALSSKYGTNFRVGSATNVLYAAAGGADDWAFGVGRVKYVYTIELRDNGRYGFLLPKNQIIPTGEETWDAVKALADQVYQSAL